MAHCIAFWVYSIEKAFEKIKKEKLISGSLRGNFWQPLISPEARKERSCQSFSASHIGPRADCPFHRPAFFRPAQTELDSEIVEMNKMKSERAQPTSLEHLDSEFLFLGTLKKLFMFISMSFT